MNAGEDSDPVREDDAGNNAVESGVSAPDYLFDVWFLMAGRIAPQLCCTNPPPIHRLFLAAVHEVARDVGDIDRAVNYLHEIVTTAPPEWMVFQQAGQLLSIIEWRRKYHPVWFSSDLKRRRVRPGRCGPYIARAMAFLQAGSDSEAMELAGKIIRTGDSGSDDRRLAILIRAAILICSGEADAGEAELQRILER